MLSDHGWLETGRWKVSLLVFRVLDWSKMSLCLSVPSVGQGEGTGSPHCPAETPTLDCSGYFSKKHYSLLHGVLGIVQDYKLPVPMVAF